MRKLGRDRSLSGVEKGGVQTGAHNRTMGEVGCRHSLN